MVKRAAGTTDCEGFWVYARRTGASRSAAYQRYVSE